MKFKITQYSWVNPNRTGGGGGGGGWNPPLLDVSRDNFADFFPAHRAFATFSFESCTTCIIWKQLCFSVWKFHETIRLDMVYVCAKLYNFLSLRSRDPRGGGGWNPSPPGLWDGVKRPSFFRVKWHAHQLCIAPCNCITMFNSMESSTAAAWNTAKANEYSFVSCFEHE